jgi:ATP-binding cassette, subfamily C (CFTR/MRP), member 1
MSCYTRYQLDPFERHSDEEVWAVLQQVHMAGVVRAMAGGLGEPVAENGDNLSQGEKQLLCIARSLLRRARILVLDEATSACDPVTDDIIQQALRAESRLHGTTVLTIAHRLHTIMDFDKVLVMGAGRVAEFDSPAALLADSASEFSQMLADYNSSHSHT